MQLVRAEARACGEQSRARVPVPVPMPPSYDTLDDVSMFGDIIEMYDHVLGAAMKAPDLCGVLTTGTLDLSPSQHAQWGGSPATFGECPEAWHVRSAPRGRIGQPLALGEVRKVSVLVRKSATHRVARITNIKLWRLPPSSKLDGAIQHMFDAKDVRHAERSKRTYGAMGVGIHGINLFAVRESPRTSFLASSGCQTVLSAVAKITRADDNAPCKIEASTVPHFVIAASLAGFGLAGSNSALPINCEEEYDELTWDGLCGHLGLCFRDELSRTAHARNDERLGLKLMMTSEDVFEQLSLIGYLDLRADPFYGGSLPDDMHKPSGLPLILALSVMIATRPERWELPRTRMDDAYATKEAALFVDCVVPSVLAPDGESWCDERSFTFDLVMNKARSEMAEVLKRLRSSPAAGKGLFLDHRKMESSVRATWHFLFCMGVAVCEDLFGLPPTGGGCSSGQYTKYGFATQLSDPMVESRAQSAYAMDLGNVVERWPTLRTSTRGRRQLALADVLVEVNEWLCSGKYRGTILAPTTSAPVSVHKDELVRKGEPPPARTVGAPKSAKKKKRVEANALLAERSKTRDANQQHYATESMRSLFKTTTRDSQRTLSCSQNLCGAALNSASGIFCDALQLGGCGGPSFLFEFTSYLVAPTMAARCAHCANAVHVVQSIAFAPTDLRNCVACGQPRCLACVARDMETGAALPADCALCRDGE